MKRPLLRSNSFVRSARRLIRKNPGASDDIRVALHLLAEDAFHPLLKTHKLKGKLGGSWACSAGYDLRIIFEFVHSTKVLKQSSWKPLERIRKSIERQSLTTLCDLFQNLRNPYPLLKID